jgi:hypothetical protein
MVTAGAGGILCTLRGDWAGMRAAHGEAERICNRLGLERTWEASFLKSYWALGEMYAGDPVRAVAMLDELVESADDLFSRAMIGSWRGRALVVSGDLAAARAARAVLERTPAARRGMASIYRGVFAAELALAEHDWNGAHRIASDLAAETRAQWLGVMPAISAMVDVVLATAELGRGRPRAARAIARRLYRYGRSSFYAATALRLWSQAERNDALLERARAVASERGGRIDQLAISALRGEHIAAGPLAAAIAWSTAGAVCPR